MKLKDFEIGKPFFGLAGFEWLCTDKGTRTITAIMLEPDKDSSWFIGPPYAVDEVVFDEYDMEKCYPNTKEMIIDRTTKMGISSHPGFDADDMEKMTDDMLDSEQYHRKNLMKRDRVSKNGEILHPYSATRKEDGWYIKTFELFSREYSEMHEDKFVELSLSNESALKNRKDQFDK